MNVTDSERQFFTQCAMFEPASAENDPQMVGDIELPDFNELMHELASIYFNLGPTGYAEAIEDHRSKFAVGCAWNENFKQILLIGLRMGIDENNGACANELGSFYYIGDIVEQDYAKAAEYYEIAANLGYVQAIVNLGYIYEYGRIGQPDYAKAYMYYSFAAAAFQDAEALYKMGDLFSGGKGVEQNKKAALTLWQSSFDNAASEEIKAQPALRMANVLVDQEECDALGVQLDPLTALQLFQMAEIGLRQSIANGLTYYEKRLREAIEGQAKARGLLDQQVDFNG